MMQHTHVHTVRVVAVLCCSVSMHAEQQCVLPLRLVD
jgi:hypothetical protein